MAKNNQDTIKTGIANKDILKNTDIVDKIYVEVNAKFNDDHIDMGPNLVLPKGQTIQVLNSSRLLVFATLLEKMIDSALIAVAIFEKVEDDQYNELDKVDVTIEGLSSSMQSASAEYPDFTIMLIASFEELAETKVCYDSNCLKNH